MIKLSKKCENHLLIKAKKHFENFGDEHFLFTWEFILGLNFLDILIINRHLFFINSIENAFDLLRNFLFMLKFVSEKTTCLREECACFLLPFSIPFAMMLTVPGMMVVLLMAGNRVLPGLRISLHYQNLNSCLLHRFFWGAKKIILFKLK